MERCVRKRSKSIGIMKIMMWNLSKKCWWYLSPPDDFEMIGKLGRGKYSEVYHGVNLRDNTPIVMKYLKPGRPTMSPLIHSEDDKN
jgi:hypothetical protein